MGSFLVGGRQLYAPLVPGFALSFEESCRRPFDVRDLLEFFATRALPGVETVDPERLLYRRTVDLPAAGPEAGDGAGSRHAVLDVDFEADGRARVQLHAADERVIGRADRNAISRRVRRLFDLDANPAAIASSLGGVPELAADGLAGRLVAALGTELPSPLRSEGLERTFPEPEQVASFDLRTIGLPSSRARALGEVASRVASGKLRLDADPQEVRKRLLALKGIGPWTVEYVAMRALGDRDAFPASDLGLRKAIDREHPPSVAELEAMAKAWRPLRAYAAILLWRSGGGG
jgi:AraC family transcriptional regulator of adaptative response / DNA-3-methyladenine glycosylase II